MATAPDEQKSDRRESFLRYIRKGIWKEQPIWAVTFLVFCAFMAAMIWVRIGPVLADPGADGLDWVRLTMALMVFVLPSLFYALYAWWTR